MIIIQNKCFFLSLFSSKLFDKVDKDHDGSVTEQELKDWIHFTQNRYIMKDVEKQMQQTDLDKDGFIDWDEYKKATYGFMNDEASKSLSY